MQPLQSSNLDRKYSLDEIDARLWKFDNNFFNKDSAESQENAELDDPMTSPAEISANVNEMDV